MLAGSSKDVGGGGESRYHRGRRGPGVHLAICKIPVTQVGRVSEIFDSSSSLSVPGYFSGCTSSYWWEQMCCVLTDESTRPWPISLTAKSAQQVQLHRRIINKRHSGTAKLFGDLKKLQG